MIKASARGSQPHPALRSTSGAGFDFEDCISAWLLVKMLVGEPAPAVGGRGIQLQAQAASLGWKIDDILLTSRGQDLGVRRLAISAKGNLQVSANGLPVDFVQAAWEQWRDSVQPLDRSEDALALVTLGSLAKFDAAWREVKNACEGSDLAQTISRIRSNNAQNRVFNRVQQPDPKAPAETEEETVQLIRRLHVLPVDFHDPHSEKASESIAHCRRLLVSGDLAEAERLWSKLIGVAADVRIRLGTITLEEAWSQVRQEFSLHSHPDYQSDWQRIINLTSSRY